MSKYNKETLQKLEKSKLIRLLEKEGIEASIHQPKTELIRLLLLAKKANAPTSPSPFTEMSPNKQRKLISLVGFLALGLFVIVLYLFNPTFQKNIQFISQQLFGTEAPSKADFGPTIYEKNGKTYVVYDYPLIVVKAISDPNCKRPECDLETYKNQINNFITPLIDFQPVDFESSEGKKLIDEYNLNLLPAFIFDANIEKTQNFETSKRNLEKINDSYILQVPPYKVVKGPIQSNARVYSAATVDPAKITLIEYTGYSCKLCADNAKAVTELANALGANATRIIKYFNTSEKDLNASIGAECAAQQNRFKEYHDTLFEKQAEWTAVADVNPRLISYAVELGLDRAQFTSCLADENVKQLVQSHFTEAGSLGISAAPTLVVNNNILVGSYPVDSLKLTVQEILKAEEISLSQK